MTQFTLNQSEKEFLFRQNPNTASDGGWQSLLVKLQNQFDPKAMVIQLDAADLERIPRYAFDYGNGGWEGRLVGVFGNHLGPNLGR
ncbi:MAG: aspartyl-tRNA synthetase [Luteolibacter sp.]|uniref:aspartyl-tRNA synthetase n=1 Tax=Luteolibacter sp. TaxID=1962973 RepID=UPI0032642345